MAVWALILFTITIIPVAIIVIFTGWMKEPGKTEFFRLLSVGWIRSFFFLTGCAFKVRGRENFKKGKVYVVVANHNSFLDVLSLTPFVPGPNKTIAKAEMARIPLFGAVYRRGSILVNRKDKESRRKSFLDMIHVLQQGMHMCIYPEGTRNRTTLPVKEFHDGAFRLAMDTGKSIIPAVILNTKKVLDSEKGFFYSPGKIELHFLPEVSTESSENFEELKITVRNIMSDYFVTHQR